MPQGPNPHLEVEGSHSAAAWCSQSGIDVEGMIGSSPTSSVSCYTTWSDIGASGVPVRFWWTGRPV